MSDTEPKIIDVLRTSDRLGAEGEPIRAYRLPGLHVHAFSRPAHNDSGDLYALYYLQENRTALFVGDIAGHDFSSAIVATEVLQYIEKNHRQLAEPGRFLSRLGADTHKKFQSLQRFMTAAAFLFDKAGENIRFASAGQPASILYESAAGSAKLLRQTGLPIGFEEVDYPTVENQFRQEDMIVAVTDGVVTARNDGGEEFGYERIRRCVIDASGDPARTLNAIVGELERFETTDSTLDDCTVICIKRVA